LLRVCHRLAAYNGRARTWKTAGASHAAVAWSTAVSSTTMKLMGAGAGAGLCRLALPDRNALDYKGLFIKAE